MRRGNNDREAKAALICAGPLRKALVMGLHRQLLQQLGLAHQQ
jgi:hypothetical protein